MNSVHDMGGMHGFGAIIRDEFHAPWEGRVRSMMALMGRQRLFNLNEFRRAVESLPPAQYLTYTYFERWLAALFILLEEKAVCTAEEIDHARRRSSHERRRVPRMPTQNAPAATPPAVKRHVESATPRYRASDHVVTKLMHPFEHTRLPRYARAKRGVIDRVHGIQAFPDTSAHGRGENPQFVYSVRFAARELWGETAAPHDGVYIDLWESYLEPA